MANIEALLSQLRKEKISDADFWSVLDNMVQSLNEKDSYTLLKRCLNSGILNEHKINPYYALFLIKKLNLQLEEVRHYHHFWMESCVFPTQKSSYCCSRPSMYGQSVFAVRLLNYDIHRWMIAPKSNIYNHGINILKGDTLLSPKEIVVLDLETTGLNPLEDDVIEIAFLDIETGKEYSRLLPLKKKKSIPKEIVELVGITDDMVKDAEPMGSEELDDLINDFKLTEKVILIWSGINMFDAHFTSKLFFDSDNKSFQSLTFVSGMEILKHYKQDDFGNFSKDYVAKRYGIDATGSHRALTDCKIEAQIYERMFKELNKDD